MVPWLPGWARRSLLRRRYDRLARAHIGGRLPAIQGALDAAPSGYVLVFGDSHAELIGRHGLGDRPIVNAGIGGMSSRRWALTLPRLHVPVRAFAAIVSTGANDIMARADPRSRGTSAGFEEAVRTILAWLSPHADAVWVLAVPPIEPLAHAPRDAAAVDDYSRRLERLARRYEFGFVDPYAALRDGDGGLARPGTLTDGVHLADYATPVAKLLPLLDGHAPTPSSRARRGGGSAG